MKQRSIIMFCVVLLGLSASSAFAQTANRIEATAAATQAAPGQKVKIKADDGLEIVGLFYPAATKGPAVLLLHDAVATKAQWVPYVPAFTGAGYNVLVVDQRGFGETSNISSAGTTGDMRDKDVLAMTGWLRQQPTVDAGAVALIGARLGANFAIRGCAADPQCHVVIALTPSTNFFGVTTEDAVKSMTKDKALFLVASQIGENGAKTIKALQAAAPGEVNILTRIYGLGFDYGTTMFDNDPTLMPMVLMWLKTYNHS